MRMMGDEREEYSAYCRNVNMQAEFKSAEVQRTARLWRMHKRTLKQYTSRGQPAE